MRRTAGLAVLALLALGLGTVTPPADASGRAIRVTKTTDDAPNGCTRRDCSLREAIIKANSRKHGGTIVLRATSYDLTITGAGEDGAATGDLDIRRKITIKGTPGVTTISQSAADRVFHIVDSTTGALTLTGVTVTGGDVTGDGGGIAVDAGRALTLVGSTITANHASDAGGGIADDGGTVRLLRSTVASNIAGTDASGPGGGIYANGPGMLSLTESTISGNSAPDSGGGIDLEQPDAAFTLLRSTVSGNQSAYRGGGLALTLTTATLPFTLQDSTISGNGTTGEAGGLLCQCVGELLMNHVTLTNNTADTDANNSSVQYGGVEVQLNDMRMEASIVAGNHDAGQTNAEDCGLGGSILSLDFNVVGQANCLVTAQGSDQTVSDTTFLDALGGYGGPTFTQEINNPMTAPVDAQSGPDCGGTDQRGVPRPQGGGCDAGAYEYATCGGVVVNTVGTNHRDHLVGTVANDGILGLGGNDTISGLDGNDGICGGRGKDKIDGGTGNDTCIGGPAHDKFKNCEIKQQ